LKTQLHCQTGGNTLQSWSKVIWKVLWISI
jgi:hypothetical protein